MIYVTKSLKRDGLTFTAEFHDLGSEQGYHAVTAFRVEAAGQTIDAFRDGGGPRRPWTGGSVGGIATWPSWRMRCTRRGWRSIPRPWGPWPP
jgi:hypothetical protein